MLNIHSKKYNKLSVNLQRNIHVYMELILNTYIKVIFYQIFLLKSCITVPVCYKVISLKVSYPLHVPVVQLLILCVIHVHWRIFIHLNLSSLIWVINHLHLLVEGKQSSAVVAFYLLIICSAHQLHSIHHLHMSRYNYTIPWQKWISESRAWRCSWRKSVIVCQAIRTISVDIQFSLFHLCNERLFVIGSIWCLWNQSNRSPIFSSYLCQGIV